MKRYIALLRGVNVGGKNKISTAEFKAILEELGFADVRTYLNSGNAAFSSDADDEGALAASIRDMLGKQLALFVPVRVISRDWLRDVLSSAPDWWGSGDGEIYDNLILTLPPATGAEIGKRLGAPSAGLERVCICGDAIFWSFDRRSYARCSWWKRSASPGIGEWITIRTAGTMKKLAAL